MLPECTRYKFLSTVKLMLLLQAQKEVVLNLGEEGRNFRLSFSHSKPLYVVVGYQGSTTTPTNAGSSGGGGTGGYNWKEECPPFNPPLFGNCNYSKIPGCSGGGYSGIFTDSSLSVSSVILIAGGGGGECRSHASYRGGNGGNFDGQTGSHGHYTHPNGVHCSHIWGGAGGTQQVGG